MIIVVEGPDGAGKTTLIHDLKASLPRYFITLSVSRPPINFTQVNQYLSWVARKPLGLDLLFDRHPAISEPIYGPLLRDQNLIPKPDVLSHRLLKNVDCIVYCRPPRLVISKNVRRSHQMAGVPEHIEPLIDRYDSFMASLAMTKRVIRYNFTETDVSSIVEELLGVENGHRIPHDPVEPADTTDP